MENIMPDYFLPETGAVSLRLTT